ncbi:MAG TPA: EAL domain-containing protein [Egicoccus sp.]|nr:EAL domain-containing protein [Egicoccus sp.]HSK25044.1 EAL domain-containing protein [Egicoccus sp.]
MRLRRATSVPDRRSGQPGQGPVWVLTAAMAAVAATLTITVVRGLDVVFVDLQIPFWAFVPAFVIAELLVVHVHLGRSTQALSLSETPLVVGLAFLGPLGLIAARMIGSTYTLAVHVKLPPIKLAFNLAMGWLETAVALLALHAVLGDAPAVGPRGWLAVVAAVAAMDIVSGVCLATVVWLYERTLTLGGAIRIIASGLRAAIANASFGVVVVTVLAVDWRGVWALAVVGATLVLSYRAYAGLHRSHEEMRRVQQFTRTVQDAPDAEAAAIVLLEQAVSLLRAELAEVRLLERSDRTMGLRLRDGVLKRLPVETAPPLSLDAPLLISAGTRVAPWHHPAAWGRIDELMAVPLRGDDGSVIGELWVVNRLDDVTTFEDRDLRLLETIAGQAAVVFSNTRLVERLRDQAELTLHQARHDELTGLPNRAHFHELVRATLETGRPAAVLLLDLDRFKEVNDTLGHEAGDHLLRQVATRLRAATQMGVTVARLGGDEFAILLPGVASGAEARVAAHQVLGGFEVPFEVDEVSLDVAVSLGLVVAPEHGDQPEVLLQRADVAMYRAKEHRTGVEVYAPENDPYSPRRLAMVHDLRQAIDAGHLAVHYQPLLDLLTGGIRGVEALVRWHHPGHGPIGPDEFIPLAEQTGLIVPLTEFVLRTALQQCRTWRAAGAGVEMAVNVSARSLLDLQFPELVERMLREARLPANVLTLEITETGILVDSVRTKEILERLSGMGVKLAIDDFGTGYSSLARLKDLPVDELKVDRSFVSNMTVNRDDHAIVASTIELGRNLGLLVVAEGVEDGETLAQLSDLGCHVGQGMHFGHALPADRMTERLGLPALAPVVGRIGD